MNTAIRQFLSDHCPVLARILGPKIRAVALLSFLYIAGILHWTSQFDYALFTNQDWSLVMKYNDILREALTRREAPYLMTYKLHYSDRFLALPESPLSPQYLLLTCLDNSQFNHFNILFLYSISFLGLLWIRKEWRLTALPFTFLYLLFGFNGYIVSRITVGHTMWYGYFFLPYFHLLMLRVVNGVSRERTWIMLVFVLFLMLLQGAFLMYTWCLMYLGLILVLNPRRWKPVLYVCAGSVLVSLFRFLPAAVSFKSYNLLFIGGYPSLGSFLDAFTVVRDFRNTYPCNASSLGWWEFDCFIGLTGLAMLLYFCLLIRFPGNDGCPSANTPRQPAVADSRELDFANLVMLILCFGGVFSIVAGHSLPLLSAQRVSMRLIVIPVTMLMILASVRMRWFLETGRRPWATRAFLTICLALLAWELHVHSASWRIFIADLFYMGKDLHPPGPGSIEPPALADPGVRLYIHMVWLSFALSFCALLFFAGRFVQISRRPGVASEAGGFRP